MGYELKLTRKPSFLETNLTFQQAWYQKHVKESQTQEPAFSLTITRLDHQLAFFSSQKCSDFIRNVPDFAQNSDDADGGPRSRVCSRNTPAQPLIEMSASVFRIALTISPNCLELISKVSENLKNLKKNFKKP